MKGQCENPAQKKAELFSNLKACLAAGFQRSYEYLFFDHYLSMMILGLFKPFSAAPDVKLPAVNILKIWGAATKTGVLPISSERTKTPNSFRYTVPVAEIAGPRRKFTEVSSGR